MKKLIFITLFAAVITHAGFAQRSAIELTFTAINGSSWVQLDSIKIINRTKQCDTMIHYPDTVLLLHCLGVSHDQDLLHPGFRIFQNYPNPVKDRTRLTLNMPLEGEVCFRIVDPLGRVIRKIHFKLIQGYHNFTFTPGYTGLYFLTASWNNYHQTIKIISNNKTGKICDLIYNGMDHKEALEKSNQIAETFHFNLGDELLFTGYNNSMGSRISEEPDSSQTYVFQFVMNIPCRGIPIVKHENQMYHTVQIFNQCWLKENLNSGMMIDVSENMTDNGILEKYCYENDEENCLKYGGLYRNGEMMHYAFVEGSQGICPDGWHVPTNDEWDILINNLGGNAVAGGKMKEAGYIHWFVPNTGATNLSGFKALPGGYEGGISPGDFNGKGKGAYFCSSFYYGNYKILGRHLNYANGYVVTFYTSPMGCSVRCLKD